MHPGPSGHQVLAELLAGVLSQTAAEVLDGRAPAARGDPRLEGLPPPMIPRYEGQHSSLCLQLVSEPGGLLFGCALLRCALLRCDVWAGLGWARWSLPTFNLLSAQEEFRPVVRQQQGFTYRPEKPQLRRWIEQKWGWSADEPGAWAELQVDTRLSPDGGSSSSGMAAAPGGTQVQLSHLRSYSGMGASC